MDNNYLTYLDAYYCSKNKKVYFFAREVNGLFSIDVISKKVEFIISLAEYPKNAYNLYGSVVCIYDNRLVFSPLAADDILIYDMEHNKYQLVPVLKRYDYNGCEYKFFSVYANKDYIYLFPSHYPAIVEYNIKTQDIRYYSEWTKLCKPFVLEFDDYFRQSFCLINDTVILPFCNADKILQFDLNTKKIDIKTLNTNRQEQQGFSGICHDGNNFWLPSMYGSELFCWNYDIDKVDLVELGNRNSKKGYSYVGCMYYDNKVFVRPASKNDLCIMDVKTKVLKKINVCENLSVDNVNVGVSSTIFAIVPVETDALLINAKDGKHYIVMNDKMNLSISTIELDFNQAIEEWIKTEGRLETSDILTEKMKWDFKIFINDILGSNERFESV